MEWPLKLHGAQLETIFSAHCIALEAKLVVRKYPTKGGTYLPGGGVKNERK